MRGIQRLKEALGFPSLSREEQSALFGQLERKPYDWKDLDRARLVLTNLPEKVLTFVQGLPKLSVEKVWTQMASLSAAPHQDFGAKVPQWFILQREGKSYLVDTEGYDYIRYAARLVGMENL